MEVLLPTLALWAALGQIGLVTVPMVLLWLLLVLANRRAKRRSEDPPASEP